MLMGLNQASINTLLQAGRDFLFSHRAVSLRVNLQHFQDGMGGQ